MDFLGHWKNWIRPLALIVYFILMMIAIPVCIIELTEKGDQRPTHVKAWFTAGVFVLIAVPISLWGILQHLINYTQPHLQKYIIRIIWMVPIYALNAWFALRFPDAAIYLDTIRECYEAYVIYNFMEYLLTYLWSVNPQLNIVLERKPQQKHLIPFCFLRPWRMGSQLITYCKHGVLQYAVVRPITTIIALFCEVGSVYQEGDLNFKSAWSYLVVINNISQIWAMYNLVLFYYATKEELKPVKPVPKFMCVKFVIFFSFWQAVLIALLVKLNAIPVWEFYDTIEEVAKGIQDFCICVEMFIAAIAHRYAFPHTDFIDDTADQVNCCRSFWSMWDVSDVKDDVVEHVRVIGTGMKKTVSGPFRSSNNMGTELTPLLEASSANNGVARSNNYTHDTQVTKADIHSKQTENQTCQPDNQSAVSDWDVTSIDHWNQSTVAKSTTSSMNNFLDMSTSVDVRSIKSDVIEEHPNLDTSDALSDANKHHVDADDEHSCDTDLISFNQTSSESVVASTASKQSQDSSGTFSESLPGANNSDLQDSTTTDMSYFEDGLDGDVTDVSHTDDSVLC